MRWKTGTATAAKPGFRHFGDDRLRTNRDGAFEPFQPSCAHNRPAKRINDAATGKGEPRLRREEWMIFRFANPQGMRAAVKRPASKRDATSEPIPGHSDTPVPSRPRSEAPERTYPRAGADNLDRQTARCASATIFAATLLAPTASAATSRGMKMRVMERTPLRVLRRFCPHPTAQAARVDKGRWRCGTKARQYTGSTVTSPSAVVPCQPTPSLPSTVAAKPSLPTLWQASPRQSCRR